MDWLGKILTNGQVRNSHNILGKELKGEELTWET